MNTTPNPSPPAPAPSKATPASRGRGSRGKVVAIATTAALAALTGIALNSNRGMPATPPAAVAAHSHGPIVTRTSGAIATSQPVAARHVKQSPAQPIVTRTSGGGGGTQVEDD